jgi:hypothetical protein
MDAQRREDCVDRGEYKEKDSSHINVRRTNEDRCLDSYPRLVILFPVSVALHDMINACCLFGYGCIYGGYLDIK